MIFREDEAARADNVPDEDLAAIYGPSMDEEAPLSQEVRKNDFKPWHHPVKQIVRARQWAALTVKLLEETGTRSGVLRYFTLPGSDLLDVRVLADVCGPREVKIEYFGFDVSAEVVIQQNANVQVSAVARAGSTAESALRQAGRITDDAVILPDRLEDIAVEDSQASAQLRQRAPFDVINIDVCDHLGFSPQGRQASTFDALRAILTHQMVARSPWLLFITTRAAPELLGDPGLAFQRAITENLRVSPDSFGGALAAAIDADPGKLASALAATWNRHDINFLKLYCIGVGKFLLHFFHGQPNHPANVELASAYTYRVHHGEPDMLALAFRIRPDSVRTFMPQAGGAAILPDLEPRRAIHVASQAQKLQDLDHALEAEADVRQEAIDGTEALLASANYDIAAWRTWLQNHKSRPLQLGSAASLQ